MLTINDEPNEYYYFAVKNLSELNSCEWLRCKKAAIINNDSDFQNSLNDALIIKTLKHTQKEYQKIAPYVDRYN